MTKRFCITVNWTNCAVKLYKLITYFSQGSAATHWRGGGGFNPASSFLNLTVENYDSWSIVAEVIFKISGLLVEIRCTRVVRYLTSCANWQRLRLSCLLNVECSCFVQLHIYQTSWWHRNWLAYLLEMRKRRSVITLRASEAAAQCIVIGPVCLFVDVCLCLWVCYHDYSKLRASILTKLGL